MKRDHMLMCIMYAFEKNRKLRENKTIILREALSLLNLVHNFLYDEKTKEKMAHIINLLEQDMTWQQIDEILGIENSWHEYKVLEETISDAILATIITNNYLVNDEQPITMFKEYNEDVVIEQVFKQLESYLPRYNLKRQKPKETPLFSLN